MNTFNILEDSIQIEAIDNLDSYKNDDFLVSRSRILDMV